MKTEIVKVKGDWKEVLNDCRSSVGKGHLDKEPSDDFKRSVLISEHTPIRSISVKFIFRGIKSWIATHFARHTWYSNITTQRNDRTGKNRDNAPQGALVDFTGEANTQNLIDTSRKRLCHMAHDETREQWEELIGEIKKIDPEIAFVCVPNCIYRCGCPEKYSCGLFDKFLVYWVSSEDYIDVTHINERYIAYNIYRGEQK